ncbi:hypothetical protein ACWG0P_05715 [Amedibacillus sp. YH-ame6]
MEECKLGKMIEIKLKYSSERARALCSVLAKKNKNLEDELLGMLDQLYKRNVKTDVRAFIEELESEQ